MIHVLFATLLLSPPALPGAVECMVMRGGNLYIHSLVRPTKPDRLVMAKLNRPAYSPVTKEICYTKGGKLWLYSLKTHRKRATGFSVVGAISRPSWHPRLPFALLDSAKKYRVTSPGEETRFIWKSELFLLRSSRAFVSSLPDRSNFKVMHDAFPFSLFGASWSPKPPRSPKEYEIAFICNGDLWLGDLPVDLHFPGVELEATPSVSLQHVEIVDNGGNESAEPEETVWSPDGRWVAVSMVCEFPADRYTTIIEAKPDKERYSVKGMHPYFWGKSLVTTKFYAGGEHDVFITDIKTDKERDFPVKCDYVVHISKRSYP